MAFPMRSKNPATTKSLNSKPSITGFKMFKLNILTRKDRAEEDYDPEDSSSSSSPPVLPYSQTYNDINSDSNTGYVSIWNDSPVVKPLKNQLVPREARVTDTRIPNLKVLAQPPRSSMRDSTASSTKSIYEVQEEQEKEDIIIEEKPIQNEVSITRTMEIGHRRLLEEMANYCSREPSDRKEWGYWFEAYTKGHYNMSHPPQTPPRKVSLSWIPTPFPADEPERLRSLNRYDLSRASHIEADLRTVLRAATTALKAEYASISFVDYESETFILNHPIRIGMESKTKRAWSLGAHVMLGNDTMVILDTEKDWRFKGNPTLHSGDDRINFYAGSPLISADGYNIGVLAISGRQPRSIFGKNDLRSLNNFAHVVSTHLERLLPESRRTVSLLERQTSNIDTENRDSTASAPAKMEDRTQIERRVKSAELNQKYSGITRPKSPGPSRKVMAARLEAEKTLTKAGRSTRQYSHYQTGLPVLPSLPIPPATIDILPPRPPPTPPPSATTPTHKGQKRFRIGAQPPTPPISPSSVPGSPNSPPSTPLPLNLPLSTFQTPQNLPEARAVLSDIAQAIDFDYLYIIRLDPTSSTLAYSDLISPSSFQVVVVRSYRRNPAPPGSLNQALNTELHLKALGDRCGLTAVNSRESGKVDDDSYQVSVLLPIQRDYVDERGNMVPGPICGDGVWDRDSSEAGVRVCRGHILGAFKRRNTGNHQEAIERLRAVAGQLGELMFETKA
ncbi:hypothetical protein EYR41_008446 [Orbilia oligospora]|uniref:Uncharacterized protein n=1 Tax=Orbilia oligospora TaxID=2813651 RepID=A0A7C8K1P3_ORBOL|nr:hypothetical protein TWF751_001536 [Orbilia oligospora]TGJ66848.1 hypothetical protein EYR41_008446 [Orbilia oligospora]